MMISIVIPTYNSEKFLEATLDSIFKQNYKDLEVILVDSNSEDGTHRIFKEYKQKYPNQLFIRLMSKEGQVKAINYGLSLAKGDVLTYINSDDTYEDGCFASVETFLSKGKPDWCYGIGKVIDENGNLKRSLVTNFKKLWWKQNSSRVLTWFDYIVQPTVFFTRELWGEVGGFNPRYPLCFDYNYWLRASKVCKPKYVPCYLANWRAHKDAISVKNTNAQIEESIVINGGFAEYYGDRFIQRSIGLIEKIVYGVIK